MSEPTTTGAFAYTVIEDETPGDLETVECWDNDLEKMVFGQWLDGPKVFVNSDIQALDTVTMWRRPPNAHLKYLHDLLCLADDALCDLHGAFPLTNSQLRSDMLKIRAVTGEDYDLRKAGVKRARGI